MDDQHREIVESAVEYLEAYLELLPKLIEELRAGDLRRMTEIADAVEGAAWVSDVASGLNAAGVICEEDALTDSQKISDVIAEVKKSFEDGDYILIADILEYELIDYAKKWNEKFKPHVA